MAAQPALSKVNKEQLKENEKKWSKELMQAGWTAFPSIILEKQHALGLDALDVNIVLYLSTHWWTSENKPFPTKKTIAQALGIHPRTVQRRIADLEKGGFIRREYRKHEDNGNQANKYHFDGLIDGAMPYAIEKLENKKEKEQKEQKRRSTMKANITELFGGNK